LIYWLADDLRQRGKDRRIGGRIAVGFGQQKGAIAELAEVEDENAVVSLALFEQLAGALVILGGVLAGERLHGGGRGQRASRVSAPERVRRRYGQDI
jgi:hypothetical protein